MRAFEGLPQEKAKEFDEDELRCAISELELKKSNVHAQRDFDFFI